MRLEGTKGRREGYKCDKNSKMYLCVYGEECWFKKRKMYECVCGEECLFSNSKMDECVIVKWMNV